MEEAWGRSKSRSGENRRSEESRNQVEASRKARQEKGERKGREDEEGRRRPFLASSFRHDKMVKFGKPEATWKTVEKENSCGRGNEKFQKSYRRPEAPRELDGAENRRKTGQERQRDGH